MFVQDVFLYLRVTRHKLTVLLTNGKMQVPNYFVPQRPIFWHSQYFVIMSSLYSIKFPFHSSVFSHCEVRWSDFNSLFLILY
jgi:hypothetical protein